MSRALVLRPRRPKPRRRLTLGTVASAAAPAGAPPSAGAPRLTMAEPEETRTAWLSSLASLAIHALGLAVVLAIGLRAAEEMPEDIIPVTILEARPIELPGRSEPVAPAPRRLATRQRVTAAAVAPRAAVDMAAPQAVDVAEVDSRALELDTVRDAPAPTELRRRELRSARVDALAESAPPSAANVDLAPARVVEVDASSLRAPVVDIGGPRALDAPRSELEEPAGFEDFEGVAARDYRGVAEEVPRAAGASESGSFGAVDIDPSVAEDFALPGGSDTPQLPSSQVGVPCEESAFVQRYYQDVERRTHARWQVPDGTRPGDRAQLRVYIDTNGTARNMKVLQASSEELGASALRALRLASPFSPLDVNTRCLADLSMKITLTYGVD